MSSLEITPADVCHIGFLSSGSCTLCILAHVTNENGSFTASLVFTYLWVFVLIWGDGGECLDFTAVCVTKLLLPVGLGGNKKNGGLTLGNPATSDRGFYFPDLHTACLISLFLYNGV